MQLVLFPPCLRREHAPAKEKQKVHRSRPAARPIRIIVAPKSGIVVESKEKGLRIYVLACERSDSKVSKKDAAGAILVMRMKTMFKYAGRISLEQSP